MDVTALESENQRLQGKVADLSARLDAVMASNEALALELAKLKRQVIGPKSERRTVEASAQLSLLARPEPIAEPMAASAPPPMQPALPSASHGRRAGKGEPDEVVAAARPAACPTCKGPLRDVGAATSNRWDWKPGRFVHLRVVRPTCACDACGTLETAVEPMSFALPRSIAGNGLLAHIVVDKFADNIPLNRQVSRFGREGLEIGLSTVCDLTRSVADLVAPLVRTMRAEQLADDFLQGDDTGIPVLDGTKGQTGTGRLWVYVSRRHVVYDFTPTKHGAGPARYLTGFQGVLLADGGSEFNEAVRGAGIVRAGCWSHARRYFFDAREQSPALAEEAMKRIGVLFDIEHGIAGADLEARRTVRATETRAALDAIRAWLVEQIHGLRPKSAIGQAVSYALKQWAFLEACASHPEIPIHNNFSELQLRLPVVGRKNWLFAGSEGGATSAARLFSLIGSCRLHRLDPWAYLHDVLGRINDHPMKRLTELTPAAYAKDR